MKPKIPLGKMLVDGGFIDEFQFKSALGHQRRYGGRLASQILQLGFLTERELATVLARQQGFPAVVLRQSSFRVSNADALPKDLALRYLALPAHVEKDRILLVVANPSDMKALDEIRFIAGKRVVPHIALDTLLRDVIQKLYEARALGHEAFVFGEEADTNVGEMGHIEVVTASTPLEPPSREGTVPIGSASGQPPQQPAAQPAPAAPPPSYASSGNSGLFPNAPSASTGFPQSPQPPAQQYSRPPTAPTVAAPPPVPATLSVPGMAAVTPAMVAAQQASAPQPLPSPQPFPPPQAAQPPLAQPAPAPQAGTGYAVPSTTPTGAYPAVGAPGTGPQPAARPDPQTAPLVLLVEGDAELTARLVPALVDRGLRVTLASDGIQATNVLRTQTPDAVVVEANTHGVHGFELCQKLRASRRFIDAPVVLTTAEYRGDGFRRDLRALFGVDLVLEKPFAPQLLVRRLEELLVRGRRLEPRPDVAQQRALAAFQQATQLLSEGRVDECVAVLQRGLTEDPISEHLHFQLGNAYRRRAMDLHAIAELERALELRPDFYPALRNLATLYQERGFRRKSFELWERAMEHCPDDETRRKLREHLLSYFN